jgi:hypothetical protein
LNQFRRFGQKLEDFQRSPRNGGSDGVGEEIGTRSLSEEIDDCLRAGGVSSGGAPESLPECRVDDIDFVVDPTVLWSSSACSTEEPSPVAVVNKDLCIVLGGKICDLAKGGDVSIHAEAAISHDEAIASGSRGLLQDPLKIPKVHVLVAKPLSFAESNSIDNGGYSSVRIQIGETKNGRRNGERVPWFRESLMIASSGPVICSKIPALASKQEGYRMAASFPWKLAIALSSSVWMS